jgi:predicted lipid-binding transport protein (Tim44 family)
MKFFMLGMMSLSLILMFTGGVKLIGVISTAIFMAFVAVWAWRFPGSVEEHQRRIDNGEKVGWLK